MRRTDLSNAEIASLLAELLERLAGQLSAAEYAALHEAGLRLRAASDPVGGSAAPPPRG